MEYQQIMYIFVGLSAFVAVFFLQYDGVMSCAPKANASNPIDDEVLRVKRSAEAISIITVTNRPYNPENAKAAIALIKQRFTQLSIQNGLNLETVGHEDKSVNMGGKLAIHTSVPDRPQRCQKGIAFLEKAKPEITEIAYIFIRCPDGTTKYI
ncbi:unnamed protein product [Caenorhabditis bovis]|uniref:Uncharacterized protein n=1 Tax=Caenorhabditis bovis TaxID=2654633 RepID=A0A8S1EXK3_9PELO|nr:unnamed protein product [Caenorhabditis bovis]